MSSINARRAFLHALTPIHPGTGQAVDVVDLPIAREKATGWPLVPGSSVKGTLRGEQDDATGKKLYGTTESPGPLSFTDMRILCLPVRSFFGTFAWVTSPLVLQRFARDSKALELADLWSGQPDVSGDKCLLPAGDPPTGVAERRDSLLAKDGKVYLEDLKLEHEPSADLDLVADALAKACKLDASAFVKRFAVVPDAVFDFLCETATEVSARIALGADGTTSGDGGNLWYEEAVPAEALFHGWAVESGSSTAALAEAWAAIAGERTIQIGGNATVGRGLCRLVVAE